MDGLFHGKPLLKWMIWGVLPLFLETPKYFVSFSNVPPKLTDVSVGVHPEKKTKRGHRMVCYAAFGCSLHFPAAGPVRRLEVFISGSVFSHQSEPRLPPFFGDFFCMCSGFVGQIKCLVQPHRVHPCSTPNSKP